MAEDRGSKLEWIGDIALGLNIISVLPQLYHVYSKQDAKSLSYMWLITSMIANLLWAIFGWDKGVHVLMRTGVFFFCFYLIMGFMKYKFSR